LPRRAAIARQTIQFRLRNLALIVRTVDVANNRFQLGALFSMARYKLGALQFAKYSFFA
jgi:hypothetical protein